ncbi:hypothetical protein AVEN_128107-1 [Araneus ventricosus]|uniref:Uncharacterized protein n=1 Tax=Araneus ventricosus TaxID=182803 RepID=A0A4Y1ZZU0_ARAVE|nr:hypothetical protein AVEN_128107-1 [Araneus ventricosus]
MILNDETKETDLRSNCCKSCKLVWHHLSIVQIYGIHFDQLQLSLENMSETPRTVSDSKSMALLYLPFHHMDKTLEIERDSRSIALSEKEWKGDKYKVQCQDPTKLIFVSTVLRVRHLLNVNYA